MEADRLLQHLQTFADNILNCHRNYGSPLIEDPPEGYQLGDEYRSLPGCDPNFLVSNFASQQELMRLLSGLTTLTGDEHYLQAAKDAAGYMFEHFTSPSGLLFWGGHAAVALPMQRVIFEWGKAPAHELKCCYPFYQLLWEVDASATRKFVEAFWNAHVIDWTTLDFNRHGRYLKPSGTVWRSTYGPSDVFFWGQGLTFVNTGSDLYYAAAMLAHLAGEEEPLVWAKRLASRYVETRQDGTGISGYQFSQCARSICNEQKVRGDRAQYQYAPFIPEGHLVYESTIFRPMPEVLRRQLYLSELLGSGGEEFRIWALEEMTAWARVAYRRRDNSFIPMLTDGFSLEGFTIQRDGYFGPRGRVESPRFADADFLWMYAHGYRLSRDNLLWRMAADIARANGLGEIGQPDGEGLSLRINAAMTDYRLIYSLLELFGATRNPEFIRFGEQLAGNLLATHYREGWLLEAGIRVVNSPASLAILHLYAALRSYDKV
jgi:pectate lyase